MDIKWNDSPTVSNCAWARMGNYHLLAYRIRTNLWRWEVRNAPPLMAHNTQTLVQVGTRRTWAAARKAAVANATERSRHNQQE